MSLTLPSHPFPSFPPILPLHPFRPLPNLPVLLSYLSLSLSLYVSSVAFLTCLLSFLHPSSILLSIHPLVFPLLLTYLPNSLTITINLSLLSLPLNISNNFFSLSLLLFKNPHTCIYFCSVLSFHGIIINFHNNFFFRLPFWFVWWGSLLISFTHTHTLDIYSALQHSTSQ